MCPTLFASRGIFMLFSVQAFNLISFEIRVLVLCGSKDNFQNQKMLCST